ncbi:MAG: hypothetical protein AAF465_14030 [Pseudomonadota bacterium]
MDLPHSQRPIGALLLAFVLICGACSTETTESENIASPGIFARINVDALSTGSSKVTVELNVGGSNGTNISLTANERLEASNGIETKVMNRDTDLFDVDYEVRFDSSESSMPYRVTLFRANGEIIDGSSVFLPPNFSITLPSVSDTYSVSDNLLVAWSPPDPGRSITLGITTRCTNNGGSTTVSSQFFDLSDDGFESFPLSQLSAASSTEVDRTRDCDLSLFLERTRSGNVDPDFGSGGTMNARQVREVEDMTLRF